jgi:hypothetical protein
MWHKNGAAIKIGLIRTEKRKETFGPGLPDGLFSNQKIPIWVNFGGP